MKNIDDYESIHSVNLLYFAVGEINEYIEKKGNSRRQQILSTRLFR